VGADHQIEQVIREQEVIIIRRLMCQRVDSGWADLTRAQRASQVSVINNDAAHNTQLVSCT
jgi:hypothetical protein